MAARDEGRSAMWPTTRRSLCVVMACSDMQEADQVGRQLSQQNTGCLLTYLRSEDLLLNAPAGPVALIILATGDHPATMRRILGWLRHRWPGCPITVVGDEGCGQHEMAAREGGATFLTRPVNREHWSAIVTQALQSRRRPAPGPPADGTDAAKGSTAAG